jgi:hypothetical protein
VEEREHRERPLLDFCISNKINHMQKDIIVSLSIDELRAVIADSVSSSLKRHARVDNIQSVNRPQSNVLGFNQALKFLNEKGYLMSCSKLYKLTSTKGIPCKYFGRRLVFTHKELLAWLDSQTITKCDGDLVIANLAKSARKNLRQR